MEIVIKNVMFPQRCSFSKGLRQYNLVIHFQEIVTGDANIG